ncbi:hypothetical protein RCL1_007289 [Eukaryota sp. TZLM3-RCL]
MLPPASPPQQVRLTIFGNFVAVFIYGFAIFAAGLILYFIFGFFIVDILLLLFGLLIMLISGPSSLLLDRGSQQVIRTRRLAIFFPIKTVYSLSDFRGCTLETFTRRTFFNRTARSYRIVLQFLNQPDSPLTFSADGYFLSEKHEFVNIVSSFMAGLPITPNLSLFLFSNKRRTSLLTEVTHYELPSVV